MKRIMHAVSLSTERKGGMWEGKCFFTVDGGREKVFDVSYACKGMLRSLWKTWKFAHQRAKELHEGWYASIDPRVW